MWDEQNHKALPENTKDTIRKKLFLKIFLCNRVFVFKSKKSQPKGFVLWHQFEYIQFVFCRHFLAHEIHIIQIVYIFHKNNAGSQAGGVAVRVCSVGGPGFETNTGIFIFVVLKCMNSYNIQICVFFEFNGLNRRIHTNVIHSIFEFIDFFAVQDK